MTDKPTVKKPIAIIKKIILAIIAGILAIFFAILIFLLAVLAVNFIIHHNYTYVEGVVTSYDSSPAIHDGSYIFKIDNVAVDVGGNLRPSEVYGQLDRPLKVGDRVKAKLIRLDGQLTIYECPGCYVKKIN